MSTYSRIVLWLSCDRFQLTHSPSGTSIRVHIIYIRVQAIRKFYVVLQRNNNTNIYIVTLLLINVVDVDKTLNKQSPNSFRKEKLMTIAFPKMDIITSVLNTAYTLLSHVAFKVYINWLWLSRGPTRTIHLLHNTCQFCQSSTCLSTRARAYSYWTMANTFCHSKYTDRRKWEKMYFEWKCHQDQRDLQRSDSLSWW